MLRGHLGDRAVLRGVVMQLRDLIEDGVPILVLEECGPASVQADQYGEGGRKARALVELRLYAADGSLNPPVREILEQLR